MPNLISDRCIGRDNNLNLIRALAASLVMVSHSFPITQGPGSIEPLEPLIGRSLGWMSVSIFFILSGFLISRSFDRSDSLMRWLCARVLRLFPALIVVLLLTIFVMGPIVTQLPLADYFSNPATYMYFIRNLSLAFLQYDLPAVFETNPYGTPVNGSLWTLFYEVACYAGVFFIGICGLFKKPILFLAAFFLYCMAYYYSLYLSETNTIHPRIISLFKLSFPFILGSLVYVWRDYVPLHFFYFIILGIFVWVLKDTLFFTELFIIWIGYLTLWFGYMPRGYLLTYNKFGDFSYGIYVYAFPMQQLTVYLFGDQYWLWNVMISFPITFLLAYFSWHIIEKRALEQIKPIMAKWQKITS